MNEIFSLIVTIAILAAAIFTGMVAYEDDPKTPNWVNTSCAWASVLLGIFFLTLVF